MNTAVRNAVPLGLAALLALLSMISPFSIDTFFPSFRAMQAEFRISDLSIQQTLTAYLLPYAVMSLVHGPLERHMALAVHCPPSQNPEQHSVAAVHSAPSGNLSGQAPTMGSGAQLRAMQ